MGFFSRFGSSYVTLDSAAAKRLAQPSDVFKTVEVHPPFDIELPATLDRFVKAITEYQTRLLGIKNRSPIAAYEIQRFDLSRLRLQFALPSARLERKCRTHLSEQIPEITFEEGVNALPVREDDTVGVGVLTLRRNDMYPLETEFEQPPTNSVIASLHRHAIRDSRIVVQILFKPMAGHPVGKRLWHRKASHESRNLRSKKVGVLPWNDREATPLEREQARQIDRKAGSPRFKVSLRILVIGAGEYTPSRVEEVSGGFNIFSDEEMGQAFNTRTLRSLRNRPLLNAVERVRDRRLSHSFQLSVAELAGLLSVPDRDQDNLIKSLNGT